MKVFSLVILAALLLIINPCQAQEDLSDKILVIREGKQLKKVIVTVEAYLSGDILETTVGVRKRGERIKINDVALTGPKLGKIHYASRKKIPPSVEDEDEEPFEITKMDGLVMFGNRRKEKLPKGRLNKELFKLRVPTEKIESDKRYELVVEVESEEEAKRIPKFKFELKSLAELISE